jgi:hypothetical protein
MKRAAAPLLLLGIVLGSSAHAEDRTATLNAESLFTEGLAAMDRKDYAAACAKFEASLRLAAGVGTMLNLARCEERLGRTASAWLRYRETAAAAAAAKQPKREVEARTRAAELEPKLCRLRIRLDASLPRGGEVLRDEALVDPAAFDTPIAVDPGRHVVSVRLGGETAWKTTELWSLNETMGCHEITIHVPAISEPKPPMPSASAAVATAAPTTSKPAIVEPLPVRSHPWSTQRTWALVSVGLGAVGFGIATGLAIDARSTFRGASSQCSSAGCPEAARASASRAGSLADGATISLVVGSVGVAAGALLWFLAPQSESATGLRASLSLKTNPRDDRTISGISMTLSGRF